MIVPALANVLETGLREPTSEVDAGRPADLVAQAREGDAEAFRRLYDTHLARVYALCLRLTGERREAEEATQDVFVRAWERLATFRGESAFGTWLHRLTVNTVLGGHRRRRRRERRVMLADRTVPVETRPDERMDLEQAIAALPPACRAVFVLHDIEGWQHQEIADQAGIALGTSKAHLFRARRLLREALTR